MTTGWEAPERLLSMVHFSLSIFMRILFLNLASHEGIAALVEGNEVVASCILHARSTEAELAKAFTVRRVAAKPKPKH